MRHQQHRTLTLASDPPFKAAADTVVCNLLVSVSVRHGQSQSRSAGPPYRKWHPSRRAAQQQQQAPEDCNWRPKGAAQLPELVEEVFADAIEFMDGNQRQEVDKDTVYTASQLCHIGVDTYQDEVGVAGWHNACSRVQSRGRERIVCVWSSG